MAEKRTDGEKHRMSAGARLISALLLGVLAVMMLNGTTPALALLPIGGALYFVITAAMASGADRRP